MFRLLYFRYDPEREISIAVFVFFFLAAPVVPSAVGGRHGEPVDGRRRSRSGRPAARPALGAARRPQGDYCSSRLIFCLVPASARSISPEVNLVVMHFTRVN